MSTVDCSDVTIEADGIRLAGHLRRPGGEAASAAVGSLPGLVLTGPFTGVKEQVTGLYAARLAERGFVTLAFDHRNFGASDGHRPFHEDSAGKLADLTAATSHLATQPDVDADRIGCVGICLGGGYALKHAAFDPRIKALAMVAAAFNDPRAMRASMGDHGYRSAMASFAATAQREHAAASPDAVEYLKAVTDVDGEEAAMGGAEPFQYYGTMRGAANGWHNQVTRLSLRELLTFDAAIGAEFIAPTPTLVVHGRNDDYCPPAAAEAIHDRMDGPKSLVWLDTTNHIDLYDNPVYVDPAIDHVAEWMAKHL